MTGQPTYLLGVGATKAGTSWLYRYLSGHPDCHLRAVKELHYFNALHHGMLGRRVQIEGARAERLEDEARDAAPAKAARLGRSVQDLRDWIQVLQAPGQGHAAYQAYLGQGRGAKAVVGDITPAYAALPVARLAEMAAMARDVRMVYLLRDPVARLWSHVRMVATREGGDFAARAAQVFDRALSGAKSDVAERSDYAGALTRLRAAVQPSKLLVLLQEELFSDSGIARLCAFLGIRTCPADTSARVHEGVALAMTADQRARARAWLQPQYDFVASVFGTLPASWRATSDGVTG